MSFRDLIWHHRIYLLSAGALSLILFFIFKLLYPHPFMVMDSYVYIRPLVEGRNVNSFPMGYTWFLQLFSFFSRSATLLVWVQYLLLEASFLLFFFSLLYFFHPGSKWMKVLLFLFFFVNPLFLYCSNFIMSDALFTTLSILWITQLMWIMTRPRPYMILIHALLLLLVFTVRYNALYYPFIAAFILLAARMRPWLKVAAIALQFLFIGGFIQYTRGEMERSSGVRQFSPFGSWRMANNALYMYGHVCQEKDDTVPARFATLDLMVKRYFRAVRWVDDLSDARSGGAFYAADGGSPLLQYKVRQYGQDSVFLDLRTFGLVAPLYSAYGTYLARKYPIAYCRWFLWPSTIRYAISPTEVFSSLSPFYLRQDDIGREASSWFGLKTLMVSPDYINLRTAILSPYPMLLGIIHLAFILGLVGFLLFGGLKKAGRINAWIVITITAFWLCDLFFKITAGAIVLRHQLFLMILEFAFALVFLDFIARHSERTPLSQPQGVFNSSSE
ncbi:MAG: hypothetical protein J0H74_22315 [Chitinophagaceae bacterium]|nr:hypothetical protein [Chitinophagaceae bacterium]